MGALLLSIRDPLDAARRPMIPGTMCQCWLANPAPCATVRPSRTGCCRPRSSGSGPAEFLCEAGYPSCVHEALVEHDGELRLRLCPLTRWPFPFGGGVVENQI